MRFSWAVVLILVLGLVLFGAPAKASACDAFFGASVGYGSVSTFAFNGFSGGYFPSSTFAFNSGIGTRFVAFSPGVSSFRTFSPGFRTFNAPVAVQNNTVINARRVVIRR